MMAKFVKTVSQIRETAWRLYHAAFYGSSGDWIKIQVSMLPVTGERGGSR